MDKVRAFLRVVWQQRFWVLSVVGVLIAAVCWMLATGNVQKQFETNKGTITGKFNNMNSLTSAEFLSNEQVNAKNEEQTSLIKAQVLKLWKQLYDRQRDAVLKWPAVLGEEFLATVDKLKFRDDIKDPDMRRIYWNYIKNRFDDLVEIVDAQKMAPGTMGAAPTGDLSAAFETQPMMRAQELGPGGVPLPQEDYVTLWLDQGALRARLDYPRLPSSLQIWVTQEDLWVYETLLHAIANTNEAKKATRIDNAAIRGIVLLEVGQLAAIASREPGNILLPEGGGAVDPMAMDPSAQGMPMSEGMPMPGMEGGGEGADPDSALLAMRYVDQTGNPISDASGGFGVEYRRLPVRMRLYMDQRWIPKVLVECANAALPIEVQRVRVNPEQSGAGFDASALSAGGGAAAGGMGMGMGMEGGMGRGMPMGMGMGRGMGMGMGMEGGGAMAALPTGAGTGSNSEMAQVEIHGLVYIYNQPDEATLGAEGGEGAVPADATVAAAP